MFLYGEFGSDWLYFGTLTILVQSILYLSIKLANNYYVEYRKKKLREKYPKLFLELEKVVEKLESGPVGGEEEAPDISYLVYPEAGGLNTENSAVFHTLERAKKAAESGDRILQVMLFPPNAAEIRYLQSSMYAEDFLGHMNSLIEKWDREDGKPRDSTQEDNDEPPTTD